MIKEKILVLLEQEIPEFNYTGVGSGDVFIVFVFFIDFVIKNVKNETLLNRVVKVINEIFRTQSISEMTMLDDLAISLYDSKCYDVIRPKLGGEVRCYFDLNIEMWKKGNHI